MQLIVLEGLIGVGKSTLGEGLAKACGYKYMPEPVEDNPYLEKFYADPKRWALEMQFYLMSRRFAMHSEAVTHIWQTGQGVIQDRSIYGDAIFCELNYKQGNIGYEGWQSYLKMRDVMFRYLMVPQLTLFLDASPEIAAQRIISRGRGCEKGVPVAYLKGLADLYEGLLEEMGQRGSKVIRLDWGQFRTPTMVLQTLDSLGVHIKSFQDYPKVSG